MHIKDIVDYVKNEINFSREFCEDNVFVTLRIEPVERIIENLEQKDKDNLSYAEDLAKAEAKANKYDSLVEKIKDKKENLRKEALEIHSILIKQTKKEYDYMLYKHYLDVIQQIKVLQELLDTEKEQI